MNNSEAKLISIGIHPKSAWSHHGSAYDITDRFPIIKDAADGDYGLIWDFVTNRQEIFVRFDLIDGSPKPVQTKFMPAVPFFSGQLVAIKSTQISGNNQPTVNALKQLYNMTADPDIDPLDLGARFLNEQAEQFERAFSKWIDFQNNPEPIIGLRFMISNTLGLFELNLIDTPLVVLPSKDQGLTNN